MTDDKNIKENPALGCLIGKAWYVLLGQLAAALKEAGLDVTTSEYLILRALYTGDGIQQCEIADMVGKDKAAICRCVAALEKKGLVRTEYVSHKCLRVFLTESGRGIRKPLMDVAAKRHRALADITTPEELEIFSKVLKTIVKHK